MRNHTARLYAFAATLAVFFVLWAVIAARPWATTAAAAKPELDPRLVALDRREHRLKREAALVRRTVNRRWAGYRRRLRVREAEIAAARRRHAQQLAAAAAARARLAALQAASYPSSQSVSSSAGSVPAQAAPASSAPTRVVTLPPPVKIVTLPPATAPATSSTSSPAP